MFFLVGRNEEQHPKRDDKASMTPGFVINLACYIFISLLSLFWLFPNSNYLTANFCIFIVVLSLLFNFVCYLQALLSNEEEFKLLLLN